jgi:trehalose 6-phosphate synthase/phosphatase
MQSNATLVSESNLSADFKRFFRCQHKLLVFDYDGTLIPLVSDLEKGRLGDETRELLRWFTKCPGTKVAILSGRPADFLAHEFHGLPIYLGSEHGSSIWDYQTGKTTDYVESAIERTSEFQRIVEIFEKSARILPKSFVERKTFGIAFHYGNSPSDFADRFTPPLIKDVQSILTGMTTLYLGKNVIEVRMRATSKSHFLHRLKNHLDWKHFTTFFVGDDQNDEELFEQMKPTNSDDLSIRIGNSTTAAKYQVATQTEFMVLLQQMKAYANSDFKGMDNDAGSVISSKA